MIVALFLYGFIQLYRFKTTLIKCFIIIEQINCYIYKNKYLCSYIQFVLYFHKNIFLNNIEIIDTVNSLII